MKRWRRIALIAAATLVGVAALVVVAATFVPGFLSQDVRIWRTWYGPKLDAPAQVAWTALIRDEQERDLFGRVRASTSFTHCLICVVSTDGGHFDRHGSSGSGYMGNGDWRTGLVVHMGSDHWRFDCELRNANLQVKGQSFDLRDGQVFVCDTDGTIRQLDRTLTAQSMADMDLVVQKLVSDLRAGHAR